MSDTTKTPIARRALLAGAATGLTAAVGALAWRRLDIGGRFFNPLKLDDFVLPPVAGLAGANGAPAPGLSARDFSATPRLVVLFASWCPPCREEHPLLMRLAMETRAPIYAALYRDRPDAAREFLSKHGNPFAAIGDDSRGHFARLVGARGVPASLVVAPGPRIALRIDGQLDDAKIRDVIRPALS